MTFEVLENTEFVLIKFQSTVGDFIKTNGLSEWSLQQLEHNQVPNNLKEEVIKFYSNSFRLSGEVITFKADPFDNFEFSNVWFYVEISDYQGWMDTASLNIITDEYQNNTNLNNLTSFRDGFGDRGRFACIL
jgi:hypothetical protein